MGRNLIHTIQTAMTNARKAINQITAELNQSKQGDDEQSI
jgi:hypothetical protein